MKFAYNVEGLDQVEASLRELPVAVRGRIAGSAVRSGANIIRDEARKLAPVGDRVSLGGENQPGQLLRAIKVIVLRQRRASGRSALVVVNQRDSGINPHWIEYGTAPIRKAKGDGYLYFTINGRLIRKKQVRGITAKPFLRPAGDNNARRVKDAITASLTPAIEREVARLARRAARRARR